MRARNLKLTVQYDGTDLAGFQRQPGPKTVQGELEANLARIVGHTVQVTGAGRTDAGVHARGQVCSVQVTASIPTDRVPRAFNGLLPDDIAVASAEEVPEAFNARRDARGKVYRYTILNRRVPSPFLRRFVWHVPRPLDVGAMAEAGAALVGEHDFASFCAAGSSAQTTVRELRRVECARSADLVLVTLEASGFLYNMARIIVGTLAQVGLGKIPPGRVAEIREAADRTAAGPTAPAAGLCLERVDYGDRPQRDTGI